MSRCFSRSVLAGACGMKVMDAGYDDRGIVLFIEVNPGAHICLGEHRLSFSHFVDSVTDIRSYRGSITGRGKTSMISP